MMLLTSAAAVAAAAAAVVIMFYWKGCVFLMSLRPQSDGFFDEEIVCLPGQN